MWTAGHRCRIDCADVQLCRSVLHRLLQAMLVTINLRLCGNLLRLVLHEGHAACGMQGKPSAGP